MRRIIVKMVQKVGVEECREAGSARDALRVLDEIGIDLIITDWNMPGMTGLEFIRTVRTKEATKDTPVIMVTGHNTEEDVLTALQAGVTHYLVKPFTPAAIMERVGAILYHTPIQPRPVRVKPRCA
jgi:two-component system chemotaxis response regulator CheY